LGVFCVLLRASCFAQDKALLTSRQSKEQYTPDVVLPCQP